MLYKQHEVHRTTLNACSSFKTRTSRVKNSFRKFKKKESLVLFSMFYYFYLDKKISHQQASPATANGHCSNEQQNGGTITTRCIDCSRESWKTKRYTNVGMNTEISINPLKDVETVHAITSTASSKTNHQKSYSQNHASTSDPPPPKRGRPPLQRAPTYSNMHPKDYVVAAIPGTIPVPVSEMEFRGHFRHHSPRTSPVHLFGPSKIYPPKVDLDSVPYETIRSIHHPPLPHHLRRHSPPQHRMMKMEQERRSPPQHRMMKMEQERHSPPRRPRSRSPPIHRNGGGYMKEEPRDFYPRYPEERPRGGVYHRMSPRYYPYEVPSPAAMAGPAPVHPEAVYHPQEASRASPERHSPKVEVEPPVYVLPEDFNLKMDRFDPHMLASQPPQPPSMDFPRDHKAAEPHSPSKSPKATTQSSPTESAKSNEEIQPVAVDTPPIQHKLSCKICKQTFPTKSTLYKHLRGHSSDEKPFKCNECGQGFTLSSNLRQHRIIHRGYKPFQCEYCGKKFMRSNVYKQHRRIHTGEQMHKCDLCPSEFLQKYALVKHLKKTHNIETYDN